jgi:hypothetical protein
VNRLKKSRMLDEPTLLVHRHLLKWLKRVTIDFDAALESCGHRYIVPAGMIQDKTWWFVHDFVGRIHTNVSNLPSCLRPYLTVRNEHLMHMDVANSQPFFLALLLCNWHKNNGSINGIYNLINAKREKTREGGEEAVPLRLTKCSQSLFKWHRRLDISADTNHFIGLCEEGKLYEFLQHEMGHDSRDHTKDAFFTFLMGRPYKERPSKFRQMMTRRFPTVVEAADQIKGHDYKRMGQLLQRIESSFIIHDVCARIMKESPDAPLLTIHDSILTVPNYWDDVTTIVKDEFKRLPLKARFHEHSYAA